MARKTKLTDTVMKKIIEAIEKGNTYENAALLSGIAERTFYYWMEKGEKEQDGKYYQFLQEVKKANATAEQRNVIIIQDAAMDQWQAAAWFLERRNPAKWGRKDALRLSGASEMEERMIELFARLDKIK